MRQFGEHREGNAGLRMPQRASRCGAQLVKVVDHELQEVHAQRWRGHFPEDAAEGFAESALRALHVRQQKLRTFRAALNKRALQWQRGDYEAFFAEPD